MRWYVRTVLQCLSEETTNGVHEVQPTNSNSSITNRDRLRPPVFVIGAPRSGTTYLIEVLNKHEDVLITNELRVMTFMNRVFSRTASDKWILLNGRKQFIQHLYDEMPIVIEDFYRSLGASESTIWGDKNPHYADSKTDPECLGLIDRMFPNAQFINIVRDGRAVVASLLNRGWVEFEEAIDVWKRHVTHADQFIQTVGSERAVTIRYEDIVNDAIRTTDGVFEFLGLTASNSVIQFLKEQEQRRTPFSGPTSLNSSGSAGFGLEPKRLNAVEDAMGGMLRRLGYR